MADIKDELQYRERMTSDIVDAYGRIEDSAKRHEYAKRVLPKEMIKAYRSFINNDVKKDEAFVTVLNNLTTDDLERIIQYNRVHGHNSLKDSVITLCPLTIAENILRLLGYPVTEYEELKTPLEFGLTLYITLRTTGEDLMASYTSAVNNSKLNIYPSDADYSDDERRKFIAACNIFESVHGSINYTDKVIQAEQLNGLIHNAIRAGKHIDGVPWAYNMPIDPRIANIFNRGGVALYNPSVDYSKLIGYDDVREYVEALIPKILVLHPTVTDNEHYYVAMCAAGIKLTNMPHGNILVDCTECAKMLNTLKEEPMPAPKSNVSLLQPDVTYVRTENGKIQKVENGRLDDIPEGYIVDDLDDVACKHLWEIDHPYYCTEDEYAQRFKSFDEFLKNWGDADWDMNLLFRWDWNKNRDEEGEELEYGCDDNYRDGLLQLYFVGQRKGIIINANVEVCRNDEPRVREYLVPRLNYLKKLWSPVCQDASSVPPGDRLVFGDALKTLADPSIIPDQFILLDNTVLTGDDYARMCVKHNVEPRGSYIETSKGLVHAWGNRGKSKSDNRLAEIREKIRGAISKEVLEKYGIESTGYVISDNLGTARQILRELESCDVVGVDISDVDILPTFCHQVPAPIKYQLRKCIFNEFNNNFVEGLTEKKSLAEIREILTDIAYSRAETLNDIIVATREICTRLSKGEMSEVDLDQIVEGFYKVKSAISTEQPRPKKLIVVPMDELKQAEEVYPDTLELIAPWMEALHTNDANGFYKGLVGSALKKSNVLGSQRAIDVMYRTIASIYNTDDIKETMQTHAVRNCKKLDPTTVILVMQPRH